MCLTVEFMTDDHASVAVDSGVEFPVPADGEIWAAGAIIFDRTGRVFAQRRSPDRRLFPDAWDIVGGHVEPGESVLEALAREVTEETGWRLLRVRRQIGITTWVGDDGKGMRHEADYVVEVDGDLENPVLEQSKNSAFGWFGPEDLPRLKENLAPGQYFIHDLIAEALENRPDVP